VHANSDVVPDPCHGGGRGFDMVLDYIEDASDGLIAVLRPWLVHDVPFFCSNCGKGVCEYGSPFTGF
jgi:hypothetical protein